MKTPSLPATLLNVAFPLLAGAFLLWLLSGRFDLPAAPMDEGTLLVYPEQVLKGRLPYRDFDTAYGPANPYVLAGAFAVFGPGIFVERMVGFGYRVLILAGVFVLGRRWGTSVATGCMLLAALFVVPTNVVAYAWLGGLACVLWSLWAATKAGAPGWRFAAGLLAAAALLYRADLGLAVLLAAVAIAVPMCRRERTLLASGFACGLLPLVAIAVAAGPVKLYENLFHFPVLHSGRQLPITREAGWMLWILGLHFAGCVLAIWAGWISRRRDPRGWLLLALGLCALGCSHQAVQRFDPTHLFFAAFLSIGILPLALLSLMEQHGDAAESESRRLLSVAAVLVAIAFTSPTVVATLHQAVGFSAGAQPAPVLYLQMNGRTFPLPTELDVRRTWACLQAVQREARPGERLFVGPIDLRQANYNDTFLYHLLPQLTPATYFLEMNPGSANRPGSQLAADIASADWLILDALWDADTLDRSARAASSDPGEVVRTQFTRVHAAAGFEVYRRNASLARN